MSDVENILYAEQQDGIFSLNTKESKEVPRGGDELPVKETKNPVRDTGSTKTTSLSPRRTPFWPAWEKRTVCSLGNAVALSLNINPGALMLTKKKFPVRYKRYLARLKTAGLQAYQGGQIEVIMDHPNSGVEVNSRIVYLASFVNFSMDQERWLPKLPLEFIQLKDILNYQKPESFAHYGVDSTNTLAMKVKRKAPDKFVSALIKLLVEIAKRASINEVDFDVNEMPGTKDNLRAIAIKFDAEFCLEPRTFDDYLGYLCKFKKGSRSNDFYENLFPEYKNNVRHAPTIST